MAALDRLLAPSGLVFIGHAETLVIPGVAVRHGGRIRELRLSEGLAGSTEARPAAGSRVEAEAPALAAPARDPCPRSSRPALPGPAPAAALPAPIGVEGPSTPLERASDLANRRRFEEAIRLCQQSIREVGPTAQAYFLLGIIHQAAGDGRGGGLFPRRSTSTASTTRRCSPWP